MILPRPGESFEWRDTTSGPALVCAPLETIAPHLFTTRAWSLGHARYAPAAWMEVAAAFAPEATSFVRLHQVHGRSAVVAEDIDNPDHLPEADIVVSGDDTRAIAVQGADCVPLLLADRRLGVVAAAHGGWRGLALGVPRVAVEMLARTYGSVPADLIAAIGPSVGACCYEVGPDVLQAFVDGGFARAALDDWFQPAPAHLAGNPSMPGLPRQPRAGHRYFDGWASARGQLREAGLDEGQIFSARLCTASHPTVFCSYRRDGRETGRIAGAIRPLLRR